MLKSSCTVSIFVQLACTLLFAAFLKSMDSKLVDITALTQITLQKVTDLKEKAQEDGLLAPPRKLRHDDAILSHVRPRNQAECLSGAYFHLHHRTLALGCLTSSSRCARSFLSRNSWLFAPVVRIREDEHIAPNFQVFTNQSTNIVFHPPFVSRL